MELVSRLNNPHNAPRHNRPEIADYLLTNTKNLEELNTCSILCSFLAPIYISLSIFNYWIYLFITS